MPFNLKPLVKVLVGTGAVATPTGLYIDRLVNFEAIKTEVETLNEANKLLIDKDNNWKSVNPLTNISGCKKYEEQNVTEQNQQVTIPAYIECYGRSFPDENGELTKWDITITPAETGGQSAENKLNNIQIQNSV